MKNLMKQARKMQDEMIRTQHALEGKEVEGTSGGGSVKVIMNCKYEIVSLEIDKKVIDPDDVDMLITLIIAAISDTNEQIKEITEKELSQLTGGLVIPEKIKIVSNKNDE